MNEGIAKINKLMVEVFNDILLIEQSALCAGMFSDVSVTEVHTIEAIGMYITQTASEVAKKLKVTAGTLTVAVNNLVRKGYVERIRSENDRRIVNLSLTKKGRLLYRMHEKFHSDMVKESITGLEEEERKALTTALSNLHVFLMNSFLKNQAN